MLIVFMSPGQILSSALPLPNLHMEKETQSKLNARLLHTHGAMGDSMYKDIVLEALVAVCL